MLSFHSVLFSLVIMASWSSMLCQCQTETSGTDSGTMQMPGPRCSKLPTNTYAFEVVLAGAGGCLTADTVGPRLARSLRGGLMAVLGESKTTISRTAYSKVCIEDGETSKLYLTATGRTRRWVFSTPSPPKSVARKSTSLLRNVMVQRMAGGRELARPIRLLQCIPTPPPPVTPIPPPPGSELPPVLVCSGQPTTPVIGGGTFTCQINSFNKFSLHEEACAFTCPNPSDTPSGSVTCRMGVWVYDNPPPTCTPAPAASSGCSTPPELPIGGEGGSYNCASAAEGEPCAFSCSSGTSQGSATCVNGAWEYSDPAPSCDPQRRLRSKLLLR